MTESDKKPNISSPEIEIGRNTQEIESFLEMLAINGLGKSIYVTTELKDDSPPPNDTLSLLERLKNPPPPQIKRKLVAIALPLSTENLTPWLILTVDGKFIRVHPPSNEELINQFKESFSNDGEPIEILLNNSSQTNYDRELRKKLWPGLIMYNTATDFQIAGIEEKTKNDLHEALELAKIIRKQRLEAQLKNQRMILEKLREFFGGESSQKQET